MKLRMRGDGFLTYIIVDRKNDRQITLKPHDEVVVDFQKELCIYGDSLNSKPAGVLITPVEEDKSVSVEELLSYIEEVDPTNDIIPALKHWVEDYLYGGDGK